MTIIKYYKNLTIILLFLFFTMSCSKPNNASDIDLKVEQLIKKMTLEEKVGQMTQVDHRYLENKSDIEKYFIGSLLSGGGSVPDTNNVRSWVRMYNTYQSFALNTRLKIPLIYGIDAVHGHNNVLNATIFPHNIGLGCSNDADLVRRISKATAREVRATGLDWTFAPCVAVAQDERWGRTYESYSEDPDIVTRLGNASVQGYQGADLGLPNSILACAKHYVGDGNTVYGTGMHGKIDRGNVVLKEQELKSKYIKPFKEAIENNVGSIMVSYNSWQTEKLHGHKYLITDVLKKELKFDGFVVSDWAAIDDIDKDYKKSIIQAINAGIDMVMVPGQFIESANSYIDFIELLIESVSEGSVKMERIDDAVSRILKIKYSMGLFQKPLKDYNKQNDVGSSKNRLIARESVKKSVVLLKNKSNLLPIKNKKQTILVAGEHADNIGFQCGGWSIWWQGGSGKITEGTSILDGIKSKIGDEANLIFSENGDTDQNVDLIIVAIGEQPYAEMNGDRESLDLSKNHINLVSKLSKTGKPVILILISGRPMILKPILDKCDAILAAWLPGTEGAGISDILFGDYNPSAKLSFSWPKSMDQIPINFGDSNYDPLYKFGHGLTFKED